MKRSMCFFSKSGFTDEVYKAAERDDKIILVEWKDIMGR